MAVLEVVAHDKSKCKGDSTHRTARSIGVAHAHASSIGLHPVRFDGPRCFRIGAILWYGNW